MVQCVFVPTFVLLFKQWEIMQLVKTAPEVLLRDWAWYCCKEGWLHINWVYVCMQILIRAVARGIDVPLWVERPNIDLKICTYDRLYQDSIVIHNRLFTFTDVAPSFTDVAPSAYPSIH